MAITIVKKNVADLYLISVAKDSLSIILFNPIHNRLKGFPSLKILDHLKFSNHFPLNKEFGYYLAGYIEGDGCLVTPFVLKNPNGTKKVCSVQINFHINDLEFVTLLQKRIGHGNIYFSKTTKTVRLIIQNLAGVLAVIDLINGKMRTPKITALYTMIDWLNTHTLEKSSHLVKLPLDTSPIYSNSWFSGFIDTDGCFYIKGFTTNPKLYPGFQFYLCQREIYKSGLNFRPLFTIIADWLKVTLVLRKVDKYSQFNITTSNTISNKILIEYLKSYPLFTSKYLNYMDWLQAYHLVNEKKHKNPIIYNEIRILKSNMNSKRTKFSWEHLNKFY